MAIAAEIIVEYYIGVGFASGAVAGYGFALGTALKQQKVIELFYKNEMGILKDRVKELEDALFPAIKERRQDKKESSD